MVEDDHAGKMDRQIGAELRRTGNSHGYFAVVLLLYLSNRVHGYTADLP